MTLGPAILFLGIFDRPIGRLGQFFVSYGRVPLFFYLLHWFVIKFVNLGINYYRFGRVDWLFLEFNSQPETPVPDNVGFDLPGVYLIWLGVVLSLYFPCVWYAGFKRRHRDWTILSYL
jgi:hypothetical protein